MIRKWLTSLLALMLAMMLPFCAFADTQHTLTVIPGDVLASDEAISDLLDVLSLTLTTGEESGALSIGLDGENVLNMAFKADTSNLYVHSNLLSDDVLYLTWEDATALMTQMMAVEAGEEGAKAFEQSMEQMQLSMTTVQQPVTTVATPEESLELARQMYPDDPGMIAWLEQLYGKMVFEEGEFTAADRDAATGKVTMVMTSEDFIAMCDTNVMRSSAEEAVKAQNPELKGEELTNAVDEMLEQTREIYRQMDINVEMTMYTVDDGLTLVGLEMDFPMTVPVSETENETMNMTMDYKRLTDANGVSYKANMDMIVNDADMMEVVFDLYKGADGVSKGKLAMLVEGEEVTVMYNASNDKDVRTRRADLYLRSGAAAIVDPAASDRPIISFQVVTQPDDGKLLEAIEKADSDNAVNVMKLSEEELQTLMTDIEARGMQIVFTALGKLPPSVLTLLTSSMQ